MPKIVPVPAELVGRPFHVTEGLAYGLGEAALRSTQYSRPFCGVRARDEDGSIDGRCRAYLPRLRPWQCFSHSTAAQLWGIPLPARFEAETDIHVSSIDGTRPRLRGVRGHELHSDRARVVRHRGLPVTDPVSTWLYLAALLSFDDLVAAADHLVLVPRRPIEEEERPWARTTDLERAVFRHHDRGKAVAGKAIEWMRVGAESRQETRLRLELARRGLPEPEVNGEIVDQLGSFIAFGDLVFRPWRVVVEYDGDQHRTSTQQYRRDIERHDALIGAGWLHIRGGIHTPTSGHDSLPALTRRALTSRGWAAPAQTSLSTPPGRFWRGK